MSVPSRSRSALLGTITSQAYTIITMLVSIISTPLMVRRLDKEAYGLYILFFQVIGYLVLFDFGLGAAVIRQLALHRGDDEHNQRMINQIMSTGIIVAGALGIFIAIATGFFAPFVPHLYHLRSDLAEVSVPIIFTLGLLVGAQFMQRGMGGIFHAHHRQTLIGTATFIVNLLATIISVVLLYVGVGLWSFVYGNLFQLVAMLLVQLVLLKRYYPNLRVSFRFFNRPLLKTMFSYGIYVFIYGFATQIILNTDRLVIGKVVSLTIVSVFSLTVRIPEVTINLLSRVADNAMPAIMEIVNHESDSQAREQYRRIMLLTTALSALAFWVILCFNGWFINVWVGSSFFAGNSVLCLALSVMIQQTVVRTMGVFLSAKGTSRQLGFMSLVEAAFNITLSLFLGRIIGLPGVLIGTLIASTLTSSWYTPYLLWRHLAIPIKDSWQSIVSPLVTISLAGIVLLFLVRWLQTFLPQTFLLLFVIGIPIGSLLSGFTWLLYLRKHFGGYVPKSFRPYLFVKE